MRKETNKRSDGPIEKSSHSHISGDSTAQTKTKTKPLQPNSAKSEDAQEGDMNNGETGHDLKTRNRP